MSKIYTLSQDKVVYKVHHSVIFLDRTPYFNDVGFGVAPRTYTKRICSKDIGLRAQNINTIVGSILSPIGIHCQHNIVLLVDSMGSFFFFLFF